MSNRIFRVISSCVVTLVVAAASAGCHSKSSGGSVGSGSGGGGTHFDGVRVANGHATDHLVNSIVVGEGLLFWGVPTSVSGSNAVVRLVVYLGPFGTDDNTVLTGEQPWIFPNYDGGAENNRPATDYSPIVLNRVSGSNVLWEATITRFPTSGRFLLTITRNGSSFVASGNIYAGGLQRDSSFDSVKQSLAARYDASRMIIVTTGKP